jgi:hypothetical protein
MYGATSVADDFGACTVQHYKKLGGSDAGEGSELLHLTGTPLAFLLYFSHLQVSLAHLVPREGVYALRTQRLDFPTQVSSSWTLDDRLRVATVLPHALAHICVPYALSLSLCHQRRVSAFTLLPLPSLSTCSFKSISISMSRTS